MSFFICGPCSLSVFYCICVFGAEGGGCMCGESVSGRGNIHVYMEGWVCLMYLTACVCVGGGDSLAVHDCTFVPCFLCVLAAFLVFICFGGLVASLGHRVQCWNWKLFRVVRCWPLWNGMSFWDYSDV